MSNALYFFILLIPFALFTAGVVYTHWKADTKDNQTKG